MGIAGRFQINECDLRAKAYCLLKGIAIKIIG
jgi:hypothetical protein